MIARHEPAALPADAIPALDNGRLRAFVDAYDAELLSLSYRRMADSQRPPYASIPCGVAGLAFASCRAGEALGRPALIDRARQWIVEARAHRREPAAFSGSGFSAAVGRRAVINGRYGFDLVDAIVSHASDEQRDLEIAFDRFRRGAEAACRGSSELFDGTAGFLVGASLLAARWRDSAARRLEQRLMAALTAPSRRNELISTTEPRYLGLAHGVGGVHFALLHAFMRRGRRPPRWQVDALRGLAALGRPRERGRARPVYADGSGGELTSFCNGTAGFALLWAKVFEATGERVFRTAARQAALHVYSNRLAGADLCCGAIGASYAMLALARIDPGRGWLTRARRFATVSLASEQSQDWPHGLFKGAAGMLCLASDLVSGGKQFPLIEA